ncbi:hypothetical protein LTR16_001379 [Cryomyces antarcticus]|uniref:Secreted protein n=1 Tax=Cryomyces antarcticus TaxID=329879 RepID=A0ABR0M0Y7_9PEZI|nr:hypothetical protein LTR60_001886 [Cryomyces antarcticus]KAK5257179.1 hypothetical protein LTR16_001379 [Cryomyces antarcticus]
MHLPIISLLLLLLTTSGVTTAKLTFSFDGLRAPGLFTHAPPPKPTLVRQTYQPLLRTMHTTPSPTATPSIVDSVSIASGPAPTSILWDHDAPPTVRHPLERRTASQGR